MIRTVISIEPVRYRFSRDPWYAKVTYSDGSTWHVGPWATEWAAGKMCDELRRKQARGQG